MSDKAIVRDVIVGMASGDWQRRQLRKACSNWRLVHRATSDILKIPLRDERQSHRHHRHLHRLVAAMPSAIEFPIQSSQAAVHEGTGETSLGMWPDFIS